MGERGEHSSQRTVPVRITNKHNLPDAIVLAVKNDPYSKGDADYSISDLISPPRVLALKKKHYEELEEDVSDRVWSLFGQAVHHIAEKANVQDVAERRLYWTVLGKKISGAMDNYNPTTGVLSDYKTATAAKFSFNDFSEWEQQQNCYAQLLRWNKDAVTKLQIVGLVRDHRPREAEQARVLNKPYPGKVELIELPLWTEQRTISFIKERVAEHEQAKFELPQCTPRERWARPDTWAIKKLNQKNAVAGHSNYASNDSAVMALRSLGSGYYVEHRPGRNTRCEGYCAAANWCEQFKALGGK